MITINKDRKAYIPESDRFIGYENDNLVETRLFEICDDELSDFHFKLDIAETLNIIDLEKTMLNGEKTVLLWKISSAAIGKGGVIRVQLRAFDNEGNKVWHSQIMDFITRESVNAKSELNEEHILSEFEQVELRATNAASQAQEYASEAQSYVSTVQGISEQAESAANSAEAHCNNAKEYMNQAKDFAEKAQSDKSDTDLYKNEAFTFKAEAVSAKNQAVSAMEEAERFSIISTGAAKDSDTAKLSAKNYSLEAKAFADTAELAKNDAVSAKQEAEGLVQACSSHLLSTDNPHSVTAEQVGAYTQKEIIGSEIDESVNIRDKAIMFYRSNSYANAPFENAVIFTSIVTKIANNFPYYQIAVSRDGTIWQRVVVGTENAQNISWVKATPNMYDFTGLEKQIGSIDTALDEILSIQENLITKTA